MFDKLLARLPYNPSILHQLAFYARRLRAEQGIRRIGLFFIALAFLVQFFAVISPAQPTLADSPNDLVNGGFNSAAEAASDCEANVSAGPGTIGYGAILANYGITCAKVAAASTITINSRDWNNQLFSMGRLPYNIAGETPVTIAGSTIYARYLWGWDRAGTTSTYQALNVTSTGGQTFLLLYNCGNLTSVGFPQPVVQKPGLYVSKTTMSGTPQAGSTVSPGTILGYSIIFGNQGGPASKVIIKDPYPVDTTPTWQGSGGSPYYGFNASASLAEWGFTTVPVGANNDYVNVEYKVNAGTPNGTLICNTATIEATGVSPISTNKICMTVHVNAPTPPPTPPPAPTGCESQISSVNKYACITTAKTAANLTQNIANANGTTAQAGDLIRYTLTAANNGTSAVSGYVFSDNLSYVLDYSKIVNAGGGTLGNNSQLSWPGVNIPAGKIASVNFEVRVDNPIPQTPVSSSDPNFYNLTMNNVFGNSVNIKLPPTPAQTIEQTTAILPNTGPGNTMIFGAVVVCFAGFFYFRARLLTREAEIAVKDGTSGVLQ